MTIRPIRTKGDYDKAMARARVLMVRDDQDSIDELDVLQVLVENWERTHHAVAAVTPADAIRFRMGQTGLKPRDLVAYLGTKSRVSEVLNGQRQLTVDQIRALSQHLSIPVESLIGPTRHEPKSRPSATSVAAVEKLRKLGVMKAREELSAFLSRAGNLGPAVAMLRKTRTERTNAKTDFGAVEAWCAAVLVMADKVSVKPRKTLDAAAARQLAKVSAEPNWPSLVRSKLASLGVALVVLEHLPGTYLDGAAMCRRDGTPVIAVTLRHDRVDNFWFTLLHEFAHVCCHLSENRKVILDDLEVSAVDGIEAQADAFASNALIPEKYWNEHISEYSTADDLQLVANRAGVHPAIAAGRWQYRYGDYRRFSKLLGRGEVRKVLSGLQRV
ncbi:ImmA/IrrE family metallo-endopeptidase [Mesorhizobium tamadayense]|nr:ImmA/IrrE family metallo-endopeptidase [Mesorhizobium tamadayense]